MEMLTRRDEQREENQEIRRLRMKVEELSSEKMQLTMQVTQLQMQLQFALAGNTGAGNSHYMPMLSASSAYDNVEHYTVQMENFF
jgi:hypothetical protein